METLGSKNTNHERRNMINWSSSKLKASTNNKVSGLILPDFKTYYQPTVIKTVWNIIQSSETDACLLNYLIFHKGFKAIQVDNKRLLNKWYWNNWISILKKINLNPKHTPQTKSNSRWIIGLNVKAKTLIFFKKK